MTTTVFIRLADFARTMAALATYEVAIEAVAFAGGVPAGELRRRWQKRPELVALRRQAIYLAHMRGFSQRRIARAAGLSHEAVARACRTVEESREDPFIDRLLDELELIMIG